MWLMLNEMMAMDETENVNVLRCPVASCDHVANRYSAIFDHVRRMHTHTRAQAYYVVHRNGINMEKYGHAPKCAYASRNMHKVPRRVRTHNAPRVVDDYVIVKSFCKYCGQEIKVS